MHAAEKFFRNPAALPSMPEVATQLLRSFQREDVGLQEVVTLVGKDQGLSMKLLRLANSARYSPSHTVSSLHDAAMMIGMTSLRDLALAASFSGAFPRVPDFDRLRFWRLCLAAGGHARLLATPCGLDPDTAYLAGLMARTGELLMLLEEPEALARAEVDAQAPGRLLEEERRVLQCTHLEVTAGLARRWHFPEALVTALEAAADPLHAVPFSPLGAVLRIAGVMSEAGEMHLPPLETAMDLHPELMRLLHLDQHLPWLSARLQPHELLVAGVDDLVH